MRYVLVIVGLLAVIGGLASIKVTQIRMLIAAGEAQEKAGPPPTAVGSAEASQQAWESSIGAVGTVSAVKGVSINNDAAGVVRRIHFDSGDEVKQGKVLVQLDDSVERAQLRAASVRRDLAETRVKRSRKLRKEGVISQEELDRDESELKSAVADIALARAQIARKVIRAPFTGTLGIRRVDPGQYLAPGTPLTDLESTDSVYVDFTLPQDQAVRVGAKVRVAVQGAPGEPVQGEVSALDSRVDATNRTLRVRATVANEAGRFRPGMFAKVDLVLPDQTSVVVVPVTAVVRKTYGDSVFVIGPPGEGETATFDGKPFQIPRQKFVKVGAMRGDFIAIEKGIEPGAKVVSAGAFKLRNGARVAVDNSVQPQPKLAPQPENR